MNDKQPTSREIKYNLVGMKKLLDACFVDPRLVEYLVEAKNLDAYQESLQFAREYIFSRKSQRATVSN